MVKSLSIALGAGVLLGALSTGAAAQTSAPLNTLPDVNALPPDWNPLPPDWSPLPPDWNPLPDDFDANVEDAVQKAMAKAQDAMQKAQEKAQDAQQKAQAKAQEKADQKLFAFQNADPHPMPNVKVVVPPMTPMPPAVFGGAPADVLYQEARDSIDRERYDVALRRLNELLRQFDGKAQAAEHRVDAALYWKAYTLGKEQQYADALNTLADMQKRFADSRWLKDAKALDLELRQASGQAVSPDGQNDDELKLLALRGVMRSDPDRAVPMIEQLLAGNSSVKVKENALFVLSQSQAPRAKEIITNTAKNGTNPDLQLKAVRYLGAMRDPGSLQALDDIYRTSNDAAVKRAIIQAIASSGNRDRLVEIAKNEKDLDLRRTAIRNIGVMNGGASGDVLRSMYASETAPEIKREIINALYAQRNAAALVEMARAEKDPAMKKEIVAKLSTMRSKEATDYMLELLK